MKQRRESKLGANYMSVIVIERRRGCVAKRLVVTSTLPLK